MPKKTEQYRSFSSAAKEIGIDKDERKLIALEPGLLLEGTSEELREHVTTESLMAFFSALHGELSQEKMLLEIGNFLYSYRNDRSKEGVETLNERDRQLFHLACTLLENGFYENRLVGLNPEQAAVLAFITNVLAKTVRGSKTEEPERFSREKVEYFVESVGIYEKEQLFSEKDSETGLPSRKGTEDKIGVEIQAQITEGKKLRLALNPEKYFLSLIDGLEHAPDCFLALGLLKYDYELEPFKVAAQELRRHWKTVFLQYEELTTKVESSLKGGLPGHEGSQLREPISMRLNYILGRQQQRESPGSHNHFHPVLEKLEELIKKAEEVKPPAGPQKFKGFEEFGSTFSQTEAFKNLPEVLRSLRSFLKITDGPFYDYIKAYTRAANLIKKLYQTRRSDNLFEESTRRLMQRVQTDTNTAVPYLIKSCVIADNMTASKYPEVRAEQLAAMGRLESPYQFEDYFADRKKVPAHAFKNRWVEDRNMGYSDLHFIPEELPFAVWSLRYLRARAKNTDKK